MNKLAPVVARSYRQRVLVIAAACAITLGAVFSWPRETPADLDGPRASDRQVAIMVNLLLKKEHLLKKPLDDEISRRAIRQFLERLDPMKLYFYQSDVDEFLQQQDQLDDTFKQGNLDFAYTVFDRFLKRLDERVEMIDRLLAQEHDFTVDEEMITDADLLQYPTTPEEAYDRWRKRIKFDLLVLKTEDTQGEEAIERLTRRYHSYDKRMHQLKADDLMEMYLTAITMSFDPHTTYMSPSTLENFHISMKLNLEGIGAALMMRDGYTIVTKVIPGGAADKHGKLQPEDRIVSVGEGDEGEMVDVVDMNLNDVVQLIRGKADSVVRLGVKPANSNEVKIYKITRAKIELKDSEARGEVVEEGRKPDGTPYKIGIIDLPSFYMDMSAAKNGDNNYKSTTRDVKRILENFKGKGVDAVVLDLRHNGGGSLTEAINLTGLFIDQGPVVQVKDSDDRVQHYDDLARGMAWEGPLVVMISKMSASASEILAGAIQDYGRGVVVGDHSTHGKGTVQSLLDLGSQLFPLRNAPNLGALKITMQQFYRPSGDSTQKRGVLSDIVLPSITTHMDIGESDLDFPIEFSKVDPAEFTPAGMINESLLQELKTRSEKRRKESTDFAELERDIQRYREQKQKKSVQLNEEKFLAERAELDADKEEEKEITEQLNGDRPIFERTYYTEEVLKITTDYVRLLSNPQVFANVPAPVSVVPGK